MALSQKHQGKILVPWFGSEEWRMVYELIYSENSSRADKMQALSILRIWKTRMPVLFAGLEGSLIILEVLLLDETTLTERVLCSLFATAILRFLNICAANSDRQGTFYQTAKRRNLPEWLITIRHDLAHSQKIPSKFMLNLSLNYCLDWLKTMYWEPQNDAIEDYSINESDIEINIVEVIKFFCKTTFEFLNNQEISEVIYDDIKQVGVYIKKSTPFVNIQRSLLNVVTAQKKFWDDRKLIDVVVDNGNIFLVPNRLQSGKNNYIPKEVRQAWEVLLQYMQEQNLLISFIKKLFAITGDEVIPKNVRVMASLWLNEIFKGLLKKKDSSELIESYTSVGSPATSTPQFTNSLNFLEHNPNLIGQLDEFKSSVLVAPNEYTEIFLRNLLLTVNCPTSFISDMELAMRSFLYVNHSVSDHKLYTTEDLDKLLENDKTEAAQMVDELYNNNDSHNSSSVTVRRWHRLEETSAFDGCPIGVLPHQKRYRNPLLQ